MYLDNDAGEDQNFLNVNNNSTLSDKQKKVLIGLHSFSGNDYISSFLQKGKITCWKTLLKNEIFLYVNEAQNAVFWKYEELGKIVDICNVSTVLWKFAVHIVILIMLQVYIVILVN